MPDEEKWRLQGTVLVACNCDYGCPCNFNALPTQGKCEGHWTWHVEGRAWRRSASPRVRDPSGILGPGDCVLFERGPARAHLVRNDTQEACRLLMLSSVADIGLSRQRKSGTFARAAGEDEDSFPLFVSPGVRRRLLRRRRVARARRGTVTGAVTM